MEIAIISDTHSYMDERILFHLSESDLAIHAGDVGDPSVLDQMEATVNTICVYGNIDGTPIRKRCKEFEVLQFFETKILVIHIAGAIGRYNEMTRKLIETHKPDVLICGHSHILKVQQDQRFKLLHINPGAAGRHGFHKKRTLIKVSLTDSGLENLRVVELGSRSAKSVD